MLHLLLPPPLPRPPPPPPPPQPLLPRLPRQRFSRKLIPLLLQLALPPRPLQRLPLLILIRTLTPITIHRRPPQMLHNHRNIDRPRLKFLGTIQVSITRYGVQAQRRNGNV